MSAPYVNGNPLSLLAAQSSLQPPRSVGGCFVVPTFRSGTSTSTESGLASSFRADSSSVTPGGIQRTVSSPQAVDQLNHLFLTAVLQGNADFTTSYDLLQQYCDEQRQRLAPTGGSCPTFASSSLTLAKVPAFRSLAFNNDDRVSPSTTFKRSPNDISIEPLKLSNSQFKRPRSCTMVESPYPELKDDVPNDADLSISRCTTPQVDVSISPRKASSRARLSVSPTERKVNKSPRQVKHGLGGERRLNIHFISTGSLVEPIQTFGKYKLIIRNGLCGTHTMYAQPWRIEIIHYGPGHKAGEIRLRWSVYNMASGCSVTFVETADQARERQTKGNTICNLVVREALNKRASELEREMLLFNQSSSTRVAHLKSLVKELRPKQCTEGLLFFGLRHKAAQSRGQH